MKTGQNGISEIVIKTVSDAYGQTSGICGVWDGNQNNDSPFSNTTSGRRKRDLVDGIV